MSVEAKRMQQTKDKFFQIYQSFPDAVLVLRAGDSRVLDVNGAFEKLTGYDRDDIVGQTALQLVFFFDPDLWKKAFSELDARGEVLDLETRILRKNRTPAQVLISLRRAEISGEPCNLLVIRDMTERNRAEQIAKEREEQLKSRLDTLAAPEKDISVEEVRQVIDFQALQEMQNFFFEFTGFAMSIIDLKGNILVATGWQDICTKFHRIHPETLKYCIECDTFLTRNVQEGKYLIYKCKNNMVDAVTPIIVEGKHIANLFSGQFFLEEDLPDRNVFIDQAARYGYDKEEYLAALDKVPIWSRKAVENGMEFFARFAGMISKLSYRNIQSSQLLTDQRRAEKALRQSEDKSSRIFHFSPDAIFLMRVSDSTVLDVNAAFEKLTGHGRDEIIGHTVLQRFVSLFDSDLWEKIFSKLDAQGEARDIEARILRKDRTPADVLISVRRVEIGGEPCNLTVLRDITERKRAEKAAKEREEQLQSKLDTLLSPEKDVSTEEAGHIIDFQAIQELMNFFYKLTHIGMAIIDLKGNILVATGWQDICTKFHRVHPQTREYCNESDMYLSANVEEGQYKVYKCKNNMWDMSTPISVGGKHIANLFLGQFFFEDEKPDYGVFVAQAKKYGFNQEYLAALEQVPRWSRETVDNVMQFYTRFAGMISKLSYRNIQLARSLGEQKRLGDELQRSFDLVKQQATELAAEVVERRQAEEQLRFANAILQTQQETSLDGILVVDEGGKIISCNQRFVDMWNISAEALESKSDERVLQSVLGRLVDPEGYLAKVKDLYEHRDKKSQDEAILIGGVTFERYSAPMLGSSGEYYGRVWYFRDITERRRAEAEVKKHRDHLEELVAERTTELAVAKERAESANRAKSTFLANMSHELRTPLSAILGFSEMLAQSDRTSPDQREKLAIINRSGEHLLGMINEVLDLSKIEAGRVELEMMPFDLPRLLEDIGRMFEVRAKSAGLCFDLELGPELAPYIKADAGKLRQILINLLGNAVKFTQEGGFALRARTRPIRDDPARVELQLEVQDSGPGIPADQLERIFQPFTQLRPDHPGAKGTGLGLAISKSFMALMGGEIGVESAPGKGSLFRIDVPVELAEVDQIGGKAPEPPTVARLADGQPAWRILAVEDNPANRLLLAGLLASAGFEVQQAENGAEAVARFRDWRPHLIWMDMRMPVMDGYEATRRIRALPGGGETKILALTASVFREEREEILQTGCDDVVHKPYKAREIFDAMGTWLGARYQYAAAAAAAARAMTEPEIRAAVAALPETVKASLVDAAQCADSEGFEEALEEVRRHDPPVTVPLRALAEEFRFDRILALLASGERP